MSALKLKNNFPLAPYTTFKIGGAAEVYFEAESKQDLIDAYNLSQQRGWQFTLLGGGSNVIISDRGINGLVVRNLYQEKKILQENEKTVLLRVSSGYSMSKLAQETVAEGLSGLEYQSGLPGTVGGAIYMNSKWTKPESYVGDCLQLAELLDNSRKVKTVNRDYFQFAYDFSILQKTKEILLTAAFLLSRAEKTALQERARQTLEYRRQTQPFGVFSSGCFFKNVNGKSVGQLIDALNLKGLSVGNFSVSDKHGNFIIHKGNGKIADLKKLIALIKTKVKKKFNIELEEEVIFFQ